MNISKSQYLKGTQCPKNLWLYRHRKDLLEEMPVDEAVVARMEVGSRLGELAQQRYPAGVEIGGEYWQVAQAAEATRQQIADGANQLFEAAATSKAGCYSRIDILAQNAKSGAKTKGRSWNLIEVKSASKVKDYHYNDMAFQYYVFAGAGYKIQNCYMMLINTQYVRQGELEPSKLFYLADIQQAVLARQQEVAQKTAELRQMLDGAEPNTVMGAHCNQPFACPYQEYCSGLAPAESEAKADEPVNAEPYCEPESLAAWLSGLEYPLYFLDYETIWPAVPLFDNNRPYQQIPFQFSLHRQDSPAAKPEHHEFLHWRPGDPRQAFIRELLRLCGTEGSVVVYNQAFEKTRNNELGRDFPEYQAPLAALNERMADLLVPFRKGWLRSPLQGGSNSLKAVLPAFTDLSYEELAISDGGAATGVYLAFQQGTIGADELPQVRANLLAYCKLDTLGMVRLLQVVREKSAGR